MEIKTKSSDAPNTDEAARYAEERALSFEKLLGDDAAVALCEIEIGRAAGHPHRGDVWFAEYTLVAPHRRLRVMSKGENVNAAIDAAKDEMMQRLRADKTKRFALLRRGGAKLKEIMRFGGGE